ncbi:MAG: methylmalonyl-CoA mutase, partial [Mesorhizobium sp.]
IAHGLPAGFARRVARNAQLIMAEESHVDHVADPAGGSGAVEALTNDLCAAAWQEFQRIEAEGGVLTSLQQGYVQNRVQTAAAKRNAEYRTGSRAIIGTTLFRAGSERPVETLPAERRPALTEGVATCEPLFPVRIDQSIGAGA